MVKVIFYNLLLSKYRIKEMDVAPGTIHDIMTEIRQKHPEINEKELHSAVVFVDSKPHHYHQFHLYIEDESRIIITHFVGGG